MAQTYSLIQAQTLTSAAATVTFTNIPQNFTDLVVKISTRSAAAGSGSDFAMGMTINGVGTNRTFRRLEAYNGTVIGSDSGSTDFSAVIQGNSTTASTFNNVDIYFPNYTISNNKIFSVDGVNENNSSTGNDIYLFAGLWSQTAAITSLGFYDKGNSSNFLANSTFYLYGVGGTRAIGGTITSDSNYTYHTFTSSNTFTALEKINNAEVLMVAGGGGGSGNAQTGDGVGGGGAGGVLTQFLTLNAGTTYTTIVGAGGSGGSAGNNNGSQGSSSQLGSLTSAVGGGYGGKDETVGGSGGSGGGGGRPQAGGTATSGQGNIGGTGGGGGLYIGGGGGGAGGVGSSGTTGNGGNGTSSYSTWLSATGTGVSGFIAGGGGGGEYFSNSPGRRQGGAGGGGAGGFGVTFSGTPGSGTAGTANTGSGGGGGGSGEAGGSTTGGAGGSGLVIIRYPNI